MTRTSVAYLTRPLERSSLRFTRNDSGGTSPLITAPGAADEDFVWGGPGGTTFTGKQPDISNFPAGIFQLSSDKWDEVTQLTFSNRKLTAFAIERLLTKLTVLASLNIQTNTGLLEDVSGWVLPATLSTMYLSNTNLSGNISGWVLPTTLTSLQSYSTNLSGDVSGWVLPAILIYLYLHSTNIDYGAGGMMATATRNASTYFFQNCALAQAEVDAILADADASATTNSTLNVAGTNAAPSGGAGNANYLALLGKGWTVTIS